ncbi:MAG: energy-coupling factor transporter transmembrane protein EcfT [Spirochaetes bacterium]|nr:energy-coupling factor transporter transmembrane protein EcfT [Spirochaetota bacterium]
MTARSEFEFSVKLSIGQFVPGSSLLHMLDPRVKIVVCVMLIVSAVLVGRIFAVTLLFVLVVSVLVGTGVGAGLAFRALRPVAPFLAVLAVIQMFAIPQLRENAVIVWEWRFLHMTDRSIVSGVLLIGRFAVIVMALHLFSVTTSTNQLIHGVEQLVRPLEKIGVPAHELAMVVHISLRFLPILLFETEKLMMAQASRGADFGKGRGVRRLRRLFPLFVPMFLISLRHAEAIAESMESRCYTGGRGRTSRLRPRLKRADYLAIGAFIAADGAILAANYLFSEAVWGSRALCIL